LVTDKSYRIFGLLQRSYLTWCQKFTGWQIETKF